MSTTFGSETWVTALGLLGGGDLLGLGGGGLLHLWLGNSLDLLHAGWLCGLGLCRLRLGCLGGLWLLGHLGALGLGVNTKETRGWDVSGRNGVSGGGCDESVMWWGLELCQG